MQAWQVSQLGVAPQRVTLPSPTPAPGEVLVQVRACGRNFADLPMNDGRYQDRPSPCPSSPDWNVRAL